ncbi:hypothetical protein YBT020_05435 [Bacillus thuringiensis serovar finitimus YBT-020]|nr:hypothetical protein YBT020_05435 [Bacillus thuringiensis serovar finitimus YBT-020]
MNDQLVLMYCKDGVIYPVALTKEQQEMLPFVGMMLGEIKVVGDKPQGQAINLLGGKN